MPRSMRQYTREARRDRLGRLQRADALRRFAEKCAFDPTTGCVMWVGTTTHGKGRNEPYGYFWFDGKMWLAHRWSAHNIHGHDITGLEVDHCCPHGPSTLCVEHVKPEPGAVNRALVHTRPGRAFQSLETRRYWLFVSKGLEPPPEVEDRLLSDFVAYTPPEWLRPFLPEDAFQEIIHDDVPF